MRIKCTFIAAAVCLAALGGCVNLQVDEHSYQFNEATGNLSLRLLLLNAVRASKDYPLQFTKVQSYKGSGTSSASLQASLPIPRPGAGTITPRVDVKDGIDEFLLADLSTAEAQQELKEPLKWEAYQYFRAYAGNRSHLAAWMLMTESISMSRELHELLRGYVKNRCQDLRKDSSQFTEDFRFVNKQAACAELSRLEQSCPKLYQMGIQIPGEKGGDWILHRNETISECHFNAFTAARLQLVVVGGIWARGGDNIDEDGGPRKPTGKGRDRKDKLAPDRTKEGPGNTFNIYVADPKKEASESKRPPSLGLYFLDEDFADDCTHAKSSTKLTVKDKAGKVKEITLPLCVRKPGQPYTSVQGYQAALTLRSPERIVRYLGDLISAQSYGPHRFVPRFLDTERLEHYTLLRVERGIAPPGGSVVSVRSPDGEMFYIPQRDPDGRKEDISLETLSIVTEILNAAVSKKSFPEVTSLSVRGG